MEATKGDRKRTILDAVIDLGDGQGYKCNVVASCAYVQKTLVIGNMDRHIRNKHPEKVALVGLKERPSPPIPLEPSGQTSGATLPKVPRKEKPMLVYTNRKRILLGTLQLATENALPLSYPEYEGSVNLNGPLWESAGLTMNRRNLTILVTKAAEEARLIIRSEVERKMVNFEVDSAKRRNHNCYGIYAKYYDEKQRKVVSRGLAVKEMTSSQTGECLKETLKQEAMDKFLIRSTQVYSIAADNGANMSASIRKIGQIIDEEFQSELSQFKKEQQAVHEVLHQVDSHRMEDLVAVDEAMSDISDDDDAYQDLLDPVDAEDTAAPQFEFRFEGTRCAAHTCQLAVWDILKAQKEDIKGIKQLVKDSRQVKYKEMFVEHRAHYAPISNATRWNAVYLMLKSLKTQRSFYILLEDRFSNLAFSKHWKYIEVTVEALEPIFYLSIQLQQQHVPLSEFYAQWLICQAQLNTLTNNNTAVNLHDALKRRLKKLTETMQFKAALFMDPRFNYIGSKRISSADKDAAQSYLLQLWDRMNLVEKVSPDETPQSDPDGASNGADSLIDDYLDQYFADDSSGPSAASQENPSGNRSFIDNRIHTLIKELECQAKVPIQRPLASSIPTASKASGEPSTSTATPTARVAPTGTAASAATASPPVTASPAGTARGTATSTVTATQTVPATPSTSGTPTTNALTLVNRFDIIKYWISQRYTHPEMYRLAVVVFSAPSTQVCVERMFSALKLVLTDLRQNLSDEHIDDIMLLKVNAELLPQIAAKFDVMLQEGQDLFT